MKNKTELKRKLQQVGSDNDGYVGYYLVALHNNDNTEAKLNLIKAEAIAENIPYLIQMFVN